MTRQDLIIAALENLNAIGSGEVPSAEDVQTVNKRVNSELSQLWRRGIIPYLTDTTEFDDEMQQPLAIIIANAAAPSFGQAPNPASVLDAENLLREMQVGDGAGRGTPSALYY